LACVSLDAILFLMVLAWSTNKFAMEMRLFVLIKAVIASVRAIIFLYYLGRLDVLNGLCCFRLDRRVEVIWGRVGV